MNYEELQQRCRRIMCLPSDGTETPLDCARMLQMMSNNYSRAIAAEMLARELAEYVCDAASQLSSTKE